MTRITDILHEDQYTFMITSRSFLLKMRKISNKSCKENENFFPPKIVPFMRQSK